MSNIFSGSEIIAPSDASLERYTHEFLLPKGRTSVELKVPVDTRISLSVLLKSETNREVPLKFYPVLADDDDQTHVITGGTLHKNGECGTTTIVTDDAPIKFHIPHTDQVESHTDITGGSINPDNGTLAFGKREDILSHRDTLRQIVDNIDEISNHAKISIYTNKNKDRESTPVYEPITVGKEPIAIARSWKYARDVLRAHADYDTLAVLISNVNIKPGDCKTKFIKQFNDSTASDTHKVIEFLHTAFDSFTAGATKACKSALHGISYVESSGKSKQREYKLSELKGDASEFNDTHTLFFVLPARVMADLVQAVYECCNTDWDNLKARFTMYYTGKCRPQYTIKITGFGGVRLDPENIRGDPKCCDQDTQCSDGVECDDNTEEEEANYSEPTTSRSANIKVSKSNAITKHSNPAFTDGEDGSHLPSNISELIQAHLNTISQTLYTTDDKYPRKLEILHNIVTAHLIASLHE